MIQRAVKKGAGLVGILIAVLAAPGAYAVNLEIQFTGLNLVYDGTTIYDAGSPWSGIGSPAESDPLTSMSFFSDGTLVGSLTSDIFADIRLEDVIAIPASGGTVTSTGGIFDALMKNSEPGWGAALDADDAQITYYNGMFKLVMGGGVASLFAQDLPFGLQFDPNEPLGFTFSSSSVENLTTANGTVTGFRISGTGNITGTAQAVPEHLGSFSSGLVWLAMAALAGGRRLRRSKRRV
jgi:hypothetical protein